MKNTSRAVFTAIIIFLLYMPAAVRAVTIAKAAKLLPPETVLLIEVENFQQLQTQLKKTNFYKLYKDPAMAAFIEDTKTKLKQQYPMPVNDIFKVVVDENTLPEGRVAFAVIVDMEPATETDMALLFLSQWGKNLDKIKEAIEKSVRKAMEQDVHRKVEDYRSVEITTLIKDPPAVNTNGEQNSVPAAAPAQPEKVHYCFIDDCLLVSDDIDALQFVIAHIKGATSETLESSSDYTSAVASVGPYHDVDVYVNIKHPIQTMIAKDVSGKSKRYVENLGFDNVVSAVCSIGFGRTAASSCSGKASVRIDGAKKGVCKILDFKSSPLIAPRFISKPTCSILFLNLDIQEAFTQLANILNSFSPAYAAALYTPLVPANAETGPGVQLKTDIIDHLGSQILLAQSFKKPFDVNPNPTETILAIAVNNRSEFERSMSLLHNQMIARGNPDAKRELLGHTIYIVDLRLPFLSGGMNPMAGGLDSSTEQHPKLAFTITDTHWILGIEAIVEKAIRGLSVNGGDSIASAKWFDVAKSSIPSVVGLASLEDNSASVELLWWLAKQNDKSKTAGSVGVSASPASGIVFSEMNLSMLDTSLLPEFAAVKKYFGLSTFYGISKPEGFFFEFKDIALPSSK